MLVEPYADDEVSNNFNLVGQMYYSFSTIACVPASKSQKVGLALGAQAGAKKLSKILKSESFMLCDSFATFTAKSSIARCLSVILLFL